MRPVAKLAEKMTDIPDAIRMHLSNSDRSTKLKVLHKLSVKDTSSKTKMFSAGTPEVFRAKTSRHSSMRVSTRWTQSPISALAGS